MRTRHRFGAAAAGLLLVLIPPAPSRAQYWPGGKKPAARKPAARKPAARKPAAEATPGKPAGRRARRRRAADDPQEQAAPRVDQLGARVTGLGALVKQLQQRLDALTTRLEAALGPDLGATPALSPEQKQRLEQLGDQLAGKKQGLAKLEQAVASGLDRSVVAPSVEALEADIERIEAEMAAITARREAGGLVDKVGALTTRVAELEQQLQKRHAAASQPAKEPEKAQTGGGLIARISPKLAQILSVYGIFRLDVAVDSARAAGGGNWVFWVLRDFDGTVGGRSISDGSDGEIHLHGRNTRFGLKLDVGQVDFIRAKVFGQLELDFFGGDTANATWKALPRLRIGAVTVDWGMDWGNVVVMAGNHWDSFSKLYPSLVDAGILWWGGNLGARRPQLRLTVSPRIGEEARLSFTAAIARPFDIANPDKDGLGKVDATGKPLEVGNGTNDGEDAAIPQVQWRVGLDTPAWGGSALSVAVGGHYQRAEVARAAGSLNKTTFDSWSVAGELVLPITRWLGIRGELFVGENLKDVMGGVAQDLNPATGEEIRSLGFWAEAKARPLPWWWLAVGYGGDVPDEDTLEVETAAQLEGLRFRSQTLYVSSGVHLGKGLHAALGFMHMRTDYRLARDATDLSQGTRSHTAINNRFQLAAFYTF